MSLQYTTDELVELMDMMLRDVPKVHKGNKAAAQRIRVATIEFSKIAKEWRKLSLDVGKKKPVKKKVVAASRRKKS